MIGDNFFFYFLFCFLCSLWRLLSRSKKTTSRVFNWRPGLCLRSKTTRIWGILKLIFSNRWLFVLKSWFLETSLWLGARGWYNHPWKVGWAHRRWVGPINSCTLSLSLKKLSSRDGLDQLKAGECKLWFIWWSVNNTPICWYESH